MYELPSENELDEMHHVAVPVEDIAGSVSWYREHFACEVQYQDATWALLAFANIRLALVSPDQHPAHVCFEKPNAAEFGDLTPHRDGTKTVYIRDPSGNAIEIMAVDE